jgi:hypothetical protein
VFYRFQSRKFQTVKTFRSLFDNVWNISYLPIFWGCFRYPFVVHVPLVIMNNSELNFIHPVEYNSDPCTDNCRIFYYDREKVDYVNIWHKRAGGPVSLLHTTRSSKLYDRLLASITGAYVWMCLLYARTNVYEFKWVSARPRVCASSPMTGNISETEMNKRDSFILRVSRFYISSSYRLLSLYYKI